MTDEIVEADARKSSGTDLLLAENLSGFDFVDFGCSKGGSLRQGKTLFKGQRGLGIDIDPRKVELAKASGYDAIVADATKLQFPDASVSFSLMMHFLEHLPDARMAAACIHSAARVSRDFIYIRHPWFDSGHELLGLGYKLYWTDWRGHPNHFGVAHMHNTVSRLYKMKRFVIFGCGRIETTRHTAIVPLDAKQDSFPADESTLAERPEVTLQNVFWEIACLIQVGKGFAIDGHIEQLKLLQHEIIFDSRRAAVA